MAVERVPQTLQEAIKYYKQKDEFDRTEKDALYIFNFLNKNKNAVLDNKDGMDKWFKDYMDINVMNDISKKTFCDKIESWIDDFAQHMVEVEKQKAKEAKAAAEKKKAAEASKPPLAKVNQTQARTLASSLVNAMAPHGQTSSTGVAVAENSFGGLVATGAGIGACFGGLIGAGVGAGVGAVVGGIEYLCSDSDKERYEKAQNLFGDGAKMINEKNIVEVMRYVNPDVLNRVIDTLDDGDDSTIRQNIAQAFEDRIIMLQKAKFIDQTKAKQLLEMVSNVETNTDFKANLLGLRSGLSGVGVAEK